MKITGIKEISKESKTLQNSNTRSRLQIQIDKKGKLYCYKCSMTNYFKNDYFLTLGYIYNKMTMGIVKLWIMYQISDCILTNNIYNDYGEIIPLKEMHF